MEKLSSRKIIKEFNKYYYNSDVWLNTYWFGFKVQKCPLDMHIYQEIIYDIKPDIIIECGTKYGGSALFLAHMLDLIGKGKVISIDIVEENVPKHKRIKYLIGSSVSSNIVKKVKSLIKGKDNIIVILDSYHHKEYVIKELEIYSKFVTKNSYLILEDTNINGHPVLPDWGAGPREALNKFLRTNKNFIIDKSKEKFYMTFNPKGYLKKVK